MGGLRVSGLASRFRLRRLTMLQWALLLAALGFVVAVILTGVQSVISVVQFATARAQGADHVCADLISMGEVDDVKIVGRGLSGYACEVTFADGGLGIYEPFGGPPILVVLALALVAASAMTLLGVLCAVIARRFIALFSGRGRSRGSRWGWGLVTAGSFVFPWLYLVNYFT